MNFSSISTSGSAVLFGRSKKKPPAKQHPVKKESPKDPFDGLLAIRYMQAQVLDKPWVQVSMKGYDFEFSRHGMKALTLSNTHYPEKNRPELFQKMADILGITYQDVAQGISNLKDQVAREHSTLNHFA